MRFSAKTVLVTGGSSGIGLAVVRAFLDEAASVLIASNDRERGEAAEASLGGRVRYCYVDVREAASVLGGFEALDNWFGSIDVLVNNAGVGAVGAVDEVPVRLWDECFDTNVKGAFLCCREAIPRMRRRGGGAIINIASNAGLIARARDPVYCASKAALVMFTRSMALGHAEDRVRVNAVCPGPVSHTLIMDRNTAEAQDPEAEAAGTIAAAPLARALRRMVTPEEVAEAVLYLASDAAAIVTGAVLAVDGGKSAGIPR